MDPERYAAMKRRIAIRPMVMWPIVAGFALLAAFATATVALSLRRGQSAAWLFLLIVGVPMLAASWLAWRASFVPVSADGVVLFAFRRRRLRWSEVVGFEEGDVDTLGWLSINALTVLGGSERVCSIPPVPLGLDTRDRQRLAAERVVNALDTARLARTSGS